MRGNVYVDGFNFYYGLVRGRPADKWVDFGSLSRALLLGHHDLHRIRYFTAPSHNPLRSDPDQQIRQKIYFNALETIPNLSIHKGKFHHQPKRRPLRSDPSKLVEILDSEEKGSDVNLATHLLLDAARKDMEVALVITDDTDQIEPLRQVKLEFGVEVGVASPRQRPELSRIVRASFYRPIWPDWLRNHQFPDELTGNDGQVIKRPGTWH